MPRFSLPDIPSEMNLQRIPLDASLPELNRFAPLVELWRGKRGKCRLPPRKAFSAEDFLPRWLGWVVIDNVLEAPFDLRCSLFGSHVAELYGLDQTDIRLSGYLQHPTEGETWRRYLDHMAETARAPAFTLMHERFERNGHSVAASWLSLPLSSDDRHATHFLSGVCPHIGTS